MSIISDALKKAKESRTTQSAPVSSAPSAAPQAAPLRKEPAFAAARPQPRPAARRNALWYAPLLVLVIAGPVCFSLLTARLSGGKPAASPAGSKITTRGQFSIEERPVFMGSDRPAFALSGIAQFQESFMAVVNGHILKKGDEIGGAKVVAISADAVELEYRGERIVLEKTF